MRRPATKSKPAPTGASAPVMAKPPVPVWLVTVLLALVTIGVYWPVGHYEFTNYDDPRLIFNNPFVRGGLTLPGLCWALTTSSLEYWHPLMWLSHMLDCQFFGLWPGGHHLVSLGFHVANTLLLFAVLRRMTGALWRSAMVAALFALHPLHIESVVWLAERKDVLSGFFFLLTLWAYVRYTEGRSPKSEVQSQEAGSETTHHATRTTQHAPRFYLLSLVFFACGLMSKPMLVTVPFVLLLLDYWPLRRLSFPTLHFSTTPPLHFSITPPLRLLLEKLPFLALTAASCALTYHWALRHGNTISAEDLPWGFRLANVPVSYAQYLGKLFWPVDLAVVYPVASHWVWWQTGGAVVILVLITLFVVWRARSAPYLIVGWLIFLGMLVPTLRLAQAGFQSIADRYTYLPSIGFFIAVVWGGCELLSGLGSSRRIGSALAGSAAIVLCLVLTRLQLGYWKDSETLFRHALAVTENNYIMHINLGTALADRGQADEAISHYREALRLKPDYAIAHNSLALALGRRGQTDEAISQFQEAIRLKPNYADAYNNLGYALSLKGQADEAISQYQQALRFNPADALAHNNLGVAFARKGQMDDAISQFQQVLRLNPADADTHNNLGNALARKGRMDDAILQFQEALRLKPDSAEVHNVLGVTLLRRGRIDEAISQFQEALRLKPDLALARKYLNTALAAKAAASKPPGS